MREVTDSTTITYVQWGVPPVGWQARIRLRLRLFGYRVHDAWNVLLGREVL